MPPRDIALTVLELHPREYHWVLLEAFEAASEESLSYKPLDCAERPCSDYGQAVIEGAVALRQLQGLAPRSPVPVTVAASARPKAPRAVLFGLNLLQRTREALRRPAGDKALIARLRQLL